MIVRKLSVCSLLLLMIAYKSNGQKNEPIPIASFPEIVIDINFPAYIKLRTDGGYIDNLTQGVRGIIVYRENESSYLAYDRACSYHPNATCATVNVHSSGLFMIDPCCNSQFSMTNGSVTGGPAWQPLRRYRTEIDGSKLIISDEPLN